eukprot:snap_masked-scaffold_21-processed-gene-5.66-mRNA-1 protein AED:1.00 eAED:1.00 QI:0/0/0/0/1/1/2/0/343
MCLTVFGETSPVNKLCGSHGSCLENVCVCDSGWERSLDHVAHTYAGPGAEEIFNSLKQNETTLSLDEFMNELSLAAPCTRNTTLLNTLHITGLFVSSFSLIVILKLQKNQFRSEKYEILKVMTILCSMITNITRLSGDNLIFPFSPKVSYAICCNFILMHATIYFFFIKHTRYSLNKTKAFSALQSTLFGYNIEKLFLYQINFTFLLDVVIFGMISFSQPIIVQLQEQKNNISFAVFDNLRQLHIIQICHTVMKSLKKDLKVLTEYYRTHKEHLNQTDESTSIAVNSLLARIDRTNFLTTQLFLGGAVSFSIFLVFPPSEVLLQYLGPFLSGIATPLVAIFLY